MSDNNLSKAIATASPSQATSNQDLPIKRGDDFIGENEVMDLSDLKGKTFAVSISTGDRNKVKYLSSCLRGPYNFTEMVEEVGMMFKMEQHHAKVIVMEKDRKKAVNFLSENTVDYIEAHFVDIITESMLFGDEEKEFTCRADVLEDSMEDDPIAQSRKTKELSDDELLDATLEDTLP